MAIVFCAGCPNFPANQDELSRRLKAIEDLINNEKNVAFVNINFSEAAFQLMQDCNLITESNIEFLLDPIKCRSFDKSLFFIRNKQEGVLRRVEDDADVSGEDGYPRFYPGFDRRLELNGQKYVIVNDWYKDASVCPNKRAFYNWLKIAAQKACEEHWGGRVQLPPPPSEMDYLKAIYYLAKDLSKKVDALSGEVTVLKKNDNLNEQINELNKEIQALRELWK